MRVITEKLMDLKRWALNEVVAQIVAFQSELYVVP